MECNPKLVATGQISGETMEAHGQSAYKIVYANSNLVPDSLCGMRRIMHSNEVIYGENLNLEMDDVRWYIEEEYHWMDKTVWSEERRYNAKMRR